MNTSLNRPFRRAERVVDGRVQRGVSALDHDAREPTEHDLHVAHLINAAPRPVQISPRTLMRSIDVANFPSFIPSFRRI